MVDTVPLPGMIRGEVEVSDMLGPVLMPVQKGVAPRLALLRMRLLSLPT